VDLVEESPEGRTGVKKAAEKMSEKTEEKEELM